MRRGRGGHGGDLAALLPEDVLRRVAAASFWIALSHGVCRAWRASIDSQGLLRKELPFTGIFFRFQDHLFPSSSPGSHATLLLLLLLLPSAANSTSCHMPT